MSKTIAVALQKGGTGKTTTVATLSHALAMASFNVLAVDLDPQGNLALAFGLDPAPGLYGLLIDKETPQECMMRARPYLDLIPGDRSTAQAKEQITSALRREECLTRALKPVLGKYDFVFFDCAPSLDILNIAALVSSDWVIMPVEMSYLATVGLAQHIETLQELQGLGYDCQLKMVIPTFCDRVTRESKEILGQLKEHLGDLIAQPIPRSVRFREAPAHYKTIWEHAPNSAGALAYQDSVKRLLRDQRRY